MRDLKEFVPGRLVYAKNLGIFGFITEISCLFARYPTISFVWEDGSLSGGSFLQWNLDEKPELRQIYLTYAEFELLHIICFNLKEENKNEEYNGMLRKEYAKQEFQKLLKEIGAKS